MISMGSNMAVIGFDMLVNVAFIYDCLMWVLHEFECGFCMFSNVGMYMILNVDIYMSTNVAVIILRTSQL